MEFSEPTRIVFNRIKKLELENATKILGYLWCKGLGDQEMIKLAMSSDVVIQELIYRAKSELTSSPIPPPMNSLSILELPSPVSTQHFLSTAALRVPSPCWEPPIAAEHHLDFAPIGCPDSISELQNQTQFFSLEDQIEKLNLGNVEYASDYSYSDTALGNLCARTGGRYRSLNEFPNKTCHYFKKGFCKHGSNCRYFHGQISQSLPQLFDVIDEDQVFSANSLEKLELEIREILKSRKGYPVSIASLPMIYYENYGKHLQAEGYLTESQRYGKAGYSLTRLLARLKNGIRLIDRPHGQHAVILSEDAPKYMQNRGDRNDPGPIVSGSQQIYLTFPAESIFTEEDVSNYFSNFGPVEDVRIPSQQKRMFGFVTFESADTVKMILENRNPHYVCGARVLVKPYREKSKLYDRKYQERIEQVIYYDTRYEDTDSEFHLMPRTYGFSRLIRKQSMEKEEQALELERMRLARLQMTRQPMADRSYFGHCVHNNFSLPSAEHFGHLLDVMNSDDSPTDDKFRHKDTNHSDHDSSQGLNLPESPFASHIS